MFYVIEGDLWYIGEALFAEEAVCLARLNPAAQRVVRVTDEQTSLIWTRSYHERNRADAGRWEPVAYRWQPMRGVA